MKIIFIIIFFFLFFIAEFFILVFVGERRDICIPRQRLLVSLSSCPLWKSVDVNIPGVHLCFWALF